MKTKSEILEILGNNVETYCFSKSIDKGSSISWFEVKVNRINYVQIKKLLEEILCIEPIDNEQFNIVFSNGNVIDD